MTLLVCTCYCLASRLVTTIYAVTERAAMIGSAGTAKAAITDAGCEELEVVEDAPPFPDLATTAA